MAALGIPIAFLTPPTWKRLVGIQPGHDGAKDAARSEAIRRTRPALQPQEHCDHARCANATRQRVLLSRQQRAVMSQRRPRVSALRTNLISVTDGRSRRKADVADRRVGRLNCADSSPSGTASGRTGVRAKAAIPLRARNRLHRPLETTLFAARQQRSRRQCSWLLGFADALGDRAPPSFLGQPRLAKAFE
jgi:hypothetical protein